MTVGDATTGATEATFMTVSSTGKRARDDTEREHSERDESAPAQASFCQSA